MFLNTNKIQILALLAYLIELSDSEKLESAGDTHAIIYVFEFPPKESCKILVNLDSL